MRNEKGFSLVELIVTVGIVSVLGLLVSRSYTRYSAKARQGEAKVALAAMYSAEMAFHAEQPTYSACLTYAGYNPPGGARYYTIGFDRGLMMLKNCAGDWCYLYDYTNRLLCHSCGANCSFPGAQTYPLGVSDNQFVATATLGSLTPPDGNAILAAVPANSISSNAFVIGAVGAISAAAVNYDAWSIDQNKTILNVLYGID